MKCRIFVVIRIFLGERAVKMGKIQDITIAIAYFLVNAMLCLKPNERTT